MSRVATPSGPVTGATPTSSYTSTSPTPTTTTPSIHRQPAHVTTHPASNAYLTTLYATLGITALAATAYAAYRLYTARQAAAASAPAGSQQPGSGVADKRAPYPIVEVSDERQFDSVLQAVEAGKPAGARVFVLVEGAKEAATGVSWCGDCVTAEPVIERVFAEAKDKVSLIRAEVARAAYKGNTSHPYRVHPQLQLQRIPTLYRFSNGQVEDQLIETELHDVDKVRKFVNKP